ncbi:hypothetical protein ACFSO7_07905 [Bacillus sp. CGMCC 1.16607]|uniref:hypothetical protein n=1 Tax=Bacillus sp. CGMCC 1.16607 TaxID=3351842 RepID=UPI003633D8D6
MEKEQTLESKSRDTLDEKELEIFRLKKQIAINLWFQSIAQFAEAIALSKLFFLEDGNIDQQNLVTAVWFQAFGQLFEAIGVTNQLYADDQEALFAQRISINGDWMQSMGAGFEALTGEKIFREELNNAANELIP